MPAPLDDKCDCPFPVMYEVGNPTFLGRLVRIRLCCLMTDMEQRFETSYHEVWDGEPAHTWDEEVAQAPLPAYLARRIAWKKADGFKMDAPPEGSEDRQAMGNGVVRHIDHIIRDSDNLVETDMRKSWQRDTPDPVRH